MIKNADIEILGLYSEGFAVTIPSPLTLKIGLGKIVSEFGEVDYPEIEFDIEADNEILVVYDVYLVEKDVPEDVGVEVVRTEVGINNVPVYEGDAQLFHTLLSLQIQPGITDLNDVEITIRNIMRVFPVIEEGDPNEV